MIDTKSTNSASAPTIVENVAPQSAASSPTLTPQPELPADELARRAAISKRLAGAFGEIVSVLMRSEAHRAQMLLDLEWFVMPALSTGQFSIADAQSKTVGYSLPIGVVLWARVSPEVDKRLAANLDQPVRLKPDEWTSGDIYWLMEAVGDSRVIGPMLKGLGTSEVFNLANPGPPLTQAVFVPPNANKVDNRLVLSYVPCAVGESRRRRTRVGAKSVPQQALSVV